MNIQKIVSECLQRHRSQSTNKKKQSKSSHYSSINACFYQPQQYPYKPLINQLPKSLYQPSNKTQCSRQQIIERLYNDKRQIQAKRSMQKLAVQQQQYREKCTFQPCTNQKSRRMALKTQCTEDNLNGNAFDRLYNDAIQKKKLSQSFNYQNSLNNINANNDDKQNCTFQPQTNYKRVLNAQTCNMKPIYQRIQQILKQKRQRMKSLQENANKQQLTGQPKINQISEKITANKQQFKKSILQRIQGYISEKRKKQQEIVHQYNKNLLKQCTFKPQINNTIQVSTNFITRQQQYIKKLQSKMSSRMVVTPFQPQINKISQILVRQTRQGQTMQDKLERLTNVEYKKQKIQEIQRQIYQECTFEPQINTISKCLAAKHVSHQCNHTHKEQDYQFKPKINKLSKILAESKKLKRAESANLLNNSKKQLLGQIKMEMQYQELKQCTFRPKTNTKKYKSNINNGSLSQVKGYENFTKKIQKINQIKDEKKDIYQKLFSMEKKYKTRKSTTPMEFKLSQGFNTKEAIKQQMREKFEKQCPFRPQTMTMLR